jgi:hypothetical protein
MDSKTQQAGIQSTLTRESFSWKAPARPFKKRGVEFFTTVAVLAVLTGIILFTIEGFMPVLVIISLVFLIYVLTTVPPDEVEHKITDQGIFFAGRRIAWKNILRFWFTQRFGNDILVLETAMIPSRVEMVINSQDKEKIAKLLEEKVLYEEVPPSFLDKVALWFSKRIPLGD